MPRQGYRVGVPDPGLYREIFNSDSSFYYGSNVGNVAVPADETPWQGQLYSVLLTVPPLGVVYFKREGTMGAKSEE